MSLIRANQISGSVASASYAVTASYSLNGGGGGGNINTGSFATTGSNIFTDGQTISGSITFEGNSKINSTLSNPSDIAVEAGPGGAASLQLNSGYPAVTVYSEGIAIYTDVSDVVLTTASLASSVAITAPSFTGSLQGTASYFPAAGSDTYVQFNNNGSFDSSESFKYDYSIAGLTHGKSLTAGGSYSHAQGLDSVADGEYSHAEGKGTIAYGEASHAEGNGTQTFGVYSHAEGAGITGIYGYRADNIARGVITLESVYGDVSSEFTAFSYVIIDVTGTLSVEKMNSSEAAFYDGMNTIVTLIRNDIDIATGAVVGIVGLATPASAKELINGRLAHAEGSSFAIGTNSHAEGNGNSAVGNYSHAEGESTIAAAGASHAEGQGTVAVSYGQTAMGSYNIPTTNALVVIGNGSDETARSNVFEANDDGIVVSGSLKVSDSFNLGRSFTTSSYLVSTAGGNDVLYIPYGTNTSMFFKYTISNGAGARAGEIMAVWNNADYDWTETSTPSVGAVTASETFVFYIVGANVRLRLSSAGGYTLKSLATFI